MKGWIYVISNKAMPGLIKVGYSSKDPELRAKELNNTGSPYSYIVEYGMLIDEPFQIEQRVHKLLAAKRKGKEWFKCSAEEAVSAIQKIADGSFISQTLKKANREKDEVLRRQREEEKARAKLKNEYYSGSPFWKYWLGSAYFYFLIIAILANNGYIFSPTLSLTTIAIPCLIAGAISGSFLKNYIESRRKQSSDYQALLNRRDKK